MKTVMKQTGIILTPVSDGKLAQLKYLVNSRKLKSLVKSRNKFANRLSPQRTIVTCKKSFTTSGRFGLAQNDRGLLQIKQRA
jgi:hypothetical protein